MPDKLIDLKFAAQVWYWSNNCESVAGKRVLNEDAEKLFRKIYSSENIEEGKIEFNNVLKTLTVRKNILDETIMEKNMVESISVLNVLKQVRDSNLTIAEKNSIIRNNILIMPLSKINVLESMIGHTYDRDSIIDLIVRNVTKISTAASSKQYEEIEEFLSFAEKIFGDKFPYKSEASHVKKFYKNYVALQALYANNPDITSKEVTEFLLKNSTVDSVSWSLRAIKSLKIDDSKKAITIDDIKKIFEEIKIYYKEEEKCSIFLIKLLVIIANKPELYHLGNELLEQFSNKYDFDKLKNDIGTLKPSELIDLKKYAKVNEPTFDDNDDDILDPDSSKITLTPEEIEMLKTTFSKDTYEKIIYILNNPEEAKENKAEILISIRQDEASDFFKFINTKIHFFFGIYERNKYYLFNELSDIIDNDEDIYSYSLENFTVDNLSFYLRCFLILLPRMKKQIEFEDILMLLNKEKATILYGEELKKELIKISKNPKSYLYGKELLDYIKKIYKYDVYNEDQRDLKFAKFAFVGREEPHRISTTPDTLDLIDEAFDRYEKMKPNKFNLEDVLIFALNYEYYDKENDKYYALSIEEAKTFVKKVSEKLYKKELDKDIDNLINNYVSIKTSNILPFLMRTHSFNDVLKILKLKKELKGETGTFSGEDLVVLDNYFKNNKFYTENNYYSLMKFYEKIKANSASYAYSEEITAFYETYISRKENKIDSLEPRIEKVEKREDAESFEYKIVNRFMPTSSEEKKRSLTALVSGIGVISLLTMTAVFAMAPLKAIESCASSFETLLTNPSLSAIRDVIGAPLLYFGAIFEAFRGFSKRRFKNVYEVVTDEDKGLHR